MSSDYEKPCSSSTDDGISPSVQSASYAEESAPEERLNYPQKELEERNIVLVYNGKVLDINSELINHSLSGISLKHYNGNCLSPKEESPEENILFGEDDYYGFGESASDSQNESTEKSKSTSSMIKLCYSPYKNLSHLAVPEGGVHAEELPSCVLDKFHSRNSFWDLHKPELCKLTWPQVYVGEAIVIEHLHRHLTGHGLICSNFHDRKDLLLMLDKELDAYDKLKVIHPPTELPPDGKPFSWSKNQKMYRSGPCRPIVKSTPASGSDNIRDESDIIPNKCLHISKEEFCITIGKCIRKPSLLNIPISEQDFDSWLPIEEESEYGEYFFCLPGEEESLFMICEDEAENRDGEEVEKLEEIVPPAPVGWVEPDYCAMI